MPLPGPVLLYAGKPGCVLQILLIPARQKDTLTLVDRTYTIDSRAGGFREGPLLQGYLDSQHFIGVLSEAGVLESDHGGECDVN